MATVYSERFLIATGVNVFTVWTVPVGKRAVVRSLTGANEDGVSGAVWVYIGTNPVAVFLFPATTTSLNAETRIVLYGGEQLRCYTQSAKHHVGLHGYLFEDPTHAVGPGGVISVDELPAGASPPADIHGTDRWRRA